MPGQRLSEAVFSERFNVSRNSLREAFRLLTKDGLLRHEANHGVFVAVPIMSLVIDIYHVRRMVECGELRHASGLAQALRHQGNAGGDGRCRGEARSGQLTWRGQHQHQHAAPTKIHAAVVAVFDLLGSVRLSDFYEHIAAELKLCFRLLQARTASFPLRRHINSEILSLMEEGKAAEASDEMEIYINLSERTVLKAFEHDVEHVS